MRQGQSAYHLTYGVHRDDLPCAAAERVPRLAVLRREPDDDGDIEADSRRALTNQANSSVSERSAVAAPSSAERSISPH